MNYTLAMKRKNGEWRGASIVEGQFQDAHVSENFVDMVGESLRDLLSSDFEEGTSVAISINVDRARTDS